MLVVTGAAATGKSTIGDHLRGRSGLVVVDGDVLGRGAAATSYGRPDYVATVPAPHTWTTYDVTGGDVRRTREAGAAWAELHAT